jgi:hypothetical protein
MCSLASYFRMSRWPACNDGGEGGKSSENFVPVGFDQVHEGDQLTRTLHVQLAIDKANVEPCIICML